MTQQFAPRVVLVTGGAGFIGSNFVRYVLDTAPDVQVINLDLLTYAGNRASLCDIEARHGRLGTGRYFFIQGDIRDARCVRKLLQGRAVQQEGGRTLAVPPPDAVVHMAAESHVDRSIMSPEVFVTTNVHGTLILLEAARESWGENADRRFLHVGTDEVYGSLAPDDPPFSETSPLRPSSPYAASKAAADHLTLAHGRTFCLATTVTRCSNNFGPYQFPEKFIPLMITQAIRGQPLPVYGDGRNIRDWLFVTDHCRAIWMVLTGGAVGGLYNIGGESERRNINVARTILRLLDRPESLIRFVSDRPGHDQRYAMDITKIKRELCWSPAEPFERALQRTVQWYLENHAWWAPLRTAHSLLQHRAVMRTRHL